MLKHSFFVFTASFLVLSGCSSAQSLTADAPAVSQEVGGDTPIESDDSAADLGFTVIYRESNDAFNYSEIFYDNYTKVLYYREIDSISGSFITPLYNADGSLRTYEE